MSGITQRRVARAACAGGPEVIQIESEPLASPGPGEVLIRVEAAGLNHAESLIRSGNYAVRLPFPHAVGGEGAGVVVEAGPGAGVPVGTRVCWGAVLGSCATHVTARASMMAPIPDDMSYEDAASLAVAALTAGGLVRVWPLAGRAAAVWGAAGPVGRMLVAALAESGAEVIGIASGRRVEGVRAAGAKHAIDRAAGNVADAVRVCTNGRGVAAVFDPIGAETFEASLRMVAPGGCLISYGELSGAVPPVDLRRLFPASAFVTKYNGMRWVEGLDELGPLVAAGLALALRRPAVISAVAGRFPLDQVSNAYRLLDSGANGKVLVLPNA